MTEEQIVSEAVRLDEKGRGRIASAMLRSLPASSYDVSDQEVLDRFRELESGVAEDISLDDLINSLDYQFKK